MVNLNTGENKKLEVMTAKVDKADFVFSNNVKMGDIDYKYKEDVILSEFMDYIDKTYGEHYKTEENSVECFDAWIAMGDSTPTFRNTALKYLWRYGKKNGNNKDDLMKALHYVMMCLYVDHYKK
jgi:hypothetical protein